jgi:cytochrome P450
MTTRAPLPPALTEVSFFDAIRSFTRDPTEFFRGAVRARGPMVRLPLLRGMILVADPRAYRHILQDHAKRYVRGHAVDPLRPLLGNGLPLSDGALWLRQRRTMQPAFNRARIAALVPLLVGISERHAARYRDGDRLEAHQAMMHITRDVIVEALFSDEIGDDGRVLDDALDEIERYTAFRNFLPVWFPLWVPTPGNVRFRKAVSALDTALNGMVAARRASSARRGDLLDDLLHARDPETGAAMPDRQLRDELVNIFYSGHETTANALTWTLLLLTQNPDAEARIRDEAKRVLGDRPLTADDIPALEYTSAVFRESLRLYAPAWVFARVPEEDDVITGYFIPRRSTLLLAPCVTHRLPEYWPEPDRFDPDRFLRDPSLGVGNRSLSWAPLRRRPAPVHRQPPGDDGGRGHPGDVRAPGRAARRGAPGGGAPQALVDPQDRRRAPDPRRALRRAAPSRGERAVSALPPGPPLAVLQTARHLANPYDFFLSCQRRYGDPFTFRTLQGPVVVTGDPEGVRAILHAPPETFASFSFRPEVVKLFLGENSLVVLTGARHRAERKLLAPPFHGTRMRVYGALIQEATAIELEKLVLGERFEMQDVVQAITLTVILRAVFGVEGAGGERLFREAVTEVVHSITDNPIVLFTKVLQREFGGFGPWARFQRALLRLNELLYAEIARRRREDRAREDILSLLLAARHEDGSALSDQALRDELVTLLFAGHETTAAALGWAFHWVHRSPEILERLRQSLRALGPAPAPEDVARQPYLEAICSETLRLFPIVAAITRRLQRPLRVQGYDVPEGAGVSACIHLVHSRRDLYPDPERFDPERFSSRAYSPYEFLPFGADSRRCIGAAFAVYSMKLVLATMLRDHRFRLFFRGTPKPTRRHLMLGPPDGVSMMLEQRG